MSETLGTTSQLQLTIPTALERDWATTIRDNCFQKIVEHNHEGSGKGVKLKGYLAIDLTEALATNNTYLTARNNAGTGTVNILKVNASDEVEFDSSVTHTGLNLSSPLLTTPQINDTSSDHQYIFAVSELAADRTVTLPLLTGNDEFVFKDHTQTLTNKTLTAPVISTISNSGTITIPATTDTLVGRATSDTLTNKTIDSDNNTITNIVNADIKASAAIEYSKLSLTNSIVNADINSTAAIAHSKLAALTANRAITTDASGFIVVSSVTDTELGYVSGVTSAIQTQIDTKITDPMTTTGDIIYESAGPQRLGIGSAGQYLTVSGGVPAWDSVSVTPVAPTSKTTTYTATTSDETILADTSGGAWTLTLYAAASNSGRKITIKKTTSDTNALTIDGNASETIDGSTTIDIVSEDQAVTLICDGSNWHRIADQKGQHSMVRLHSGNGHGSTNTRIRRFTTTVTNTGSAITYADSSTAGASFTINEDGIYHITYSDGHSTAFSHGISLNSSQLTTDIENITTADILTQNALGADLNCTLNCAWSGFLSAGDVIRPHTDGNPSFGSRIVFTIAKMGI